MLRSQLVNGSRPIYCVCWSPENDSILYSEFLYLYLKTYQWEQLGSTSSIVDAINSKIIKDIELAIPDEDKLNDLCINLDTENEYINNQTLNENVSTGKEFVCLHHS